MNNFVAKEKGECRMAKKAKFKVGTKVVFYPIYGLDVPIVSTIKSVDESYPTPLYVTDTGHFVFEDKLERYDKERV